VRPFGRFLDSLARVKIKNALADILLAACAAFDPDELAESIEEGWSAVEGLMSLPPDKLGRLMMSIGSVRENMRYLRSVSPEEAGKWWEKALREISPRDIIKRISSHSPDYGAVLAEHEDWVRQEIDRAKELPKLLHYIPEQAG